jgi:hypothetical protein
MVYQKTSMQGYNQKASGSFKEVAGGFLMFIVGI